MKNRRDVLQVMGCAVPALLVLPERGARAVLGQPVQDKPQEKAPQPSAGQQDVSPAEDLMREHGVLRRVFFVYRDIIARVQNRRDFPSDVLINAGLLVRRFIEDYHERLEEDQVFPRFKKGNPLKDLVDVLIVQHAKGRELTDAIMGFGGSSLKNDADRLTLRNLLIAFVQMYEPHAAREDTVLFPAFHKLLSPKEYDALGDEFEKQEQQLFGEGGFEKNVATVAELEKKLGIGDLSRVTPEIRG
jgi:hemerythrin-like domain-containing protein